MHGGIPFHPNIMDTSQCTINGTSYSANADSMPWVQTTSENMPLIEAIRVLYTWSLGMQRAGGGGGGQMVS